MKIEKITFNVSISADYITFDLKPLKFSCKFMWLRKKLIARNFLFNGYNIKIKICQNSNTRFYRGCKVTSYSCWMKTFLFFLFFFVANLQSGNSKVEKLIVSATGWVPRYRVQETEWCRWL